MSFGSALVRAARLSALAVGVATHAGCAADDPAPQAAALDPEQYKPFMVGCKRALPVDASSADRGLCDDDAFAYEYICYRQLARIREELAHVCEVVVPYSTNYDDEIICCAFDTGPWEAEKASPGFTMDQGR